MEPAPEPPQVCIQVDTPVAGKPPAVASPLMVGQRVRLLPGAFDDDPGAREPEGCEGVLEAYDPELDWYTIRVPSGGDGGGGGGQPSRTVQARREDVVPLQADACGGGGDDDGGWPWKEKQKKQPPPPGGGPLLGDELVHQGIDVAAFQEEAGGEREPLRAASGDERTGATQQSAVRKNMLLALSVYCKLLRKCPKAMMLFYLVSVGILVGACWKDLDLETDFSAFIQADGDANRRFSAYVQARTAQKDLDDRRRRLEAAAPADLPEEDTVYRTLDGEQIWLEGVGKPEEGGGRRLGPQGRRLGGNLYFKRFLTTMYVAKHGDVLNQRVLSNIHDFELRLRNFGEWRTFCADRSLSAEQATKCDPGESFMAYAWPTQLNATAGNHRFELQFDARGRELFGLTPILDYMHKQDNKGVQAFNPLRYFPKDFDLAAQVASQAPESGVAPQAVEALRTTWTFVIAVGRAGEPMSVVKARMNQRKEEYGALITETVYPFFQAAQADYQDTLIYYSGDIIKSHEVQTTLMNDLYYAVGSFLFVTCYMWYHTRSFVVSGVSFLMILLSLPIAYVLTPAEKTTIASFMSIFLIVGIGCDVVFVFVDFWNQSESRFRKVEGAERVEARLGYTIKHAGKACLATSLTTSVSFFTNLASVLKPLREFGLFMGLCVMSAFVLVLLFLPPLLAAREIRRERIRHRVVDISVEVQKKQPLERQSSRLSEAMARMVSKTEEGYSTKLLALVFWISRCPRVIVVLAIVAVITFVTGIIQNFSVDTGMPEIFPAWHNQVAGAKAATLFSEEKPLEKRVPYGGAVCDAKNMTSPWVEGECLFNWCDTPVPSPRGELTSGTCWRGPTLAKDAAGDWKPRGWDTAGCAKVEVKSRFAAPEAPSGEEWASMWAGALSNISSLEECQGICVWEVTTFYGTLVMSETKTNSTILERRNYHNLVRGRPVGPAGDWLELVPGPGFMQIRRKVGPEERVDLAKVSGSMVPGTGLALRLEALSLEHWETGLVATSPFFSAPSSRLYPHPLTSDTYQECLNATCAAALKTCEIHTMCFFAGQRCALDGWRYLGHYMLSPEARRASSQNQPARRLASAASAVDFVQRYAKKDQLLVVVVFGIRAPMSTRLVGPDSEEWSFDPDFEPENPWAQRAMFAMCDQMPLALRVSIERCWIRKMRNWLESNNGRWPSRNFQTDVVNWYRTDPVQGGSHLWMENYKMKAAKFAFWCDVRKDMSSEHMLAYKEVWDNFVDSANARASMTASRAYHTASQWVRAEAEVAIVRSTGITIILSAVCGCLGMMMFTGDPWLSFIVLCLVLGIISGLCFFMVTLMGWAIGPIEVISLVVFVGYAVTFALHIAHDYAIVKEDDPAIAETEVWVREKAARRAKSKQRRRSTGGGEAASSEGGAGDEGEKEEEPLAPKALSPEELRVARVRVAVLHVGNAMVSSAVSTMGSSSFLLFCTLNIFDKLGAVVIAVTLLSISFALVALPAVLMLAGPAPRPWYKQGLGCACCPALRR